MTAPETVEREVQARTVAGFVAAYGVGVTTTYALIGAGKLRTVKVGRRTLIVEASARAWFDGLQATTEKVSAQSHKLPHKSDPSSGEGRRKTTNQTRELSRRP